MKRKLYGKSIMTGLIRLFRRITGCKHRYQPYFRVMDGNRKRTIWKCKRCGKEVIGD